MTKLHQFRPFWGLPNASPFCMKAETYLRYRNIEFEAVPSNPRQSPSKQIPFIVTDDGQTITDSEQIIVHFETLLPSPMDAELSNKQKALAYLSYASGIQLIEVLANILGDKPYFLGDKIHTLDMSVYAFLANIIDQPYANPLQDLMNYCQQIKQLAWRDWRTP